MLIVEISNAITVPKEWKALTTQNTSKKEAKARVVPPTAFSMEMI